MGKIQHWNRVRPDDRGKPLLRPGPAGSAAGDRAIAVGEIDAGQGMVRDWNRGFVEPGIQVDVNTALDMALQKAAPEDLIIICGSVFLVGEVDITRVVKR